MKIFYEKSFSRDLDKLKHEKAVKRNLMKLIEEVKKAASISELKDCRKLEGYKAYYRLRVGDFRLGVKVSKDGIVFVRFLHRKDIYRKFP